MARYDFRAPRLFVEAALAPAASITLDQPQAHYLCNVLRLTAGDRVLVFNGRDGEWQAVLGQAGKRKAALALLECVRPQEQAPDLHYLFAPLKHARLDYMIQKAVELGVSRLQPIMTQRGQVTRVNRDRMRANAIEAAEQCGILNIPEVAPLLSFADMLAQLPAARVLIFCDEDAEQRDPLAALSSVRKDQADPPPLAVLIGPEGGFAPEERAALLKRRNVIRLSLGPRILRADTAAIAALALVQAALGDWH